jgi:hypothetical protein
MLSSRAHLPRYLTEIVHRRPRQWFQDVDRLHEMLQSHGPEVGFDDGARPPKKASAFLLLH